MEVFTIKKIKVSLLFCSFFFFILTIISSCTNLIGDIDNGADDGYRLSIQNYSDVEYNNCTFYMGYKNMNKEFVATDSLVYKNITIFKKGDGDNYDPENGYSLTYPFHYSKDGLSKDGYWIPNREAINTLSVDKKLYFKANLEGKISISSPTSFFNGEQTLQILENEELFW